MRIKFKTTDVEKEVDIWIGNAVRLNTIMVSVASLLVWSLIGSWLYTVNGYWVEAFLFIFAGSMFFGYRKIFIFNIVMCAMSVVFSIVIGFIIITIPLSVGMLYLNVKAFIGLLQYRNEKQSPGYKL